MNNPAALAQLRKAFREHIAQSPEVVSIDRPTDPSDPFSFKVTFTFTGRLSHEATGASKYLTEFPSGLDTNLSLFLQWPYNVAVYENEIVTARGKTFKVGVVDAIKKFGGVHCYQAPLYPAGTV